METGSQRLTKHQSRKESTELLLDGGLYRQMEFPFRINYTLCLRDTFVTLSRILALFSLSCLICKIQGKKKSSLKTKVVSSGYLCRPFTSKTYYSTKLAMTVLNQGLPSLYKTQQGIPLNMKKPLLKKRERRMKPSQLCTSPSVVINPFSLLPL